MINFNKHIKCVQCGEYNVGNKYTRYNNLESEISYKQIDTGEFINFATYTNRADKHHLICNSCKFEGEIEKFKVDNYTFNDAKFALNNRHYFKCNCNSIHIEDVGSIQILNAKEHIFLCTNCNAEFTRDEFNSRVEYLTPTKIKNDMDLKKAFEQLNNDLMKSFGEMLCWNDKKNDWTYVAKVD